MTPRRLRRDKRVTIQNPVRGKDAAGGSTTTWTTLAPVWAAVRNFSGNERRATQSGGEVAEARTEFDIGYLAGVTEESRVSYGGKLYNIKHVNNLNEAKRTLILTCDTGVNDG